MSQKGQFTVTGFTEVKTLTGDVGAPATALLSNIDILGGLNIGTTSDPATHAVTIAINGTNEHCVQVGNLAGGLTNTALATADGQIFLSTLGGDPGFGTLGVGNGIAKVEGPSALSISGIDAGEAQVGVVELATDAETIAGAATVPVNTAIRPTSLKAKLGVQTLHGLPIGASDSVAIAWTAEPSDGQILIGETGAAPSLGTLTAGANIGVANAAHSITLKVAGTTDHAVQVGNATGDLTSLAVGANGETIMGATGANPGWTASPQFGGSVTALNDITSTAGNIVSLAGGVISRDATNTAAGPNFICEKVRVAGIITSGDALGQFKFQGYDGVGYITGAQITSTNSGTVGVNRIAGDLKFYTHPDATIALPSDPLLRMTITSAGNVTVAAPDAGTALTVTAGGLTVSAGDIIATLGNITASAGNLAATLGSVSAGTTVTAGTNLISTAGILSLPTTGATAGQITINSNLFMHNYGFDQANTFLGYNAGNLTLVKTNNDRGINNTGIGANALDALVGTNANEARDNTAIGKSAGTALESGSFNVIIGSSAADSMKYGTHNVLIGTSVASAYNSDESYNIVIGYGIAGTAGEDHILRIGDGTGTGAGQINAAYVAGISTNTTVAATTKLVTTTTASDKLGVVDYVAPTAWTPTVSFASGGGTAVTYTTHSGIYWQIGRMIWFDFTIQLLTKGTSTGTLEIAGLPQTPAQNTWGMVHMGVMDAGFTGTMQSLVISTSNYFRIQYTTGGASNYAQIDEGDVADTTRIRGSGFYYY